MTQQLQVYRVDGRLEAGVDECGRGCLAGPVVAAAVVWPNDYGEFDHMIKDSKKLSHQQRANLIGYIKDRALDWSIAFVDAKEVDRINILRATFKAMHGALDQLTVPFECVLVDGNRFDGYRDISHECIEKGDNTYISIAAASILAKEARDKYMRTQAEKYDVSYGWKKNVGYGTAEHIAAIGKLGLTDMHRVTFCKSVSSHGM